MSFFGLLASLAIAAIAALLFGQVVPWPAALILAAIFFAIELSGSSRGGSVKAAARIDATLLAWPIAAAAFDCLSVPGRGVRIALAAGVAAIFAGVAAGRSSGQDDARMRVLLVSALIVLYALLRALVQPVIDPYALAAGAVAAAIQLAVVASGGVVLPDRHKSITGFTAAMCACVGVSLAAGFYLKSFMH